MSGKKRGFIASALFFALSTYYACASEAHLARLERVINHSDKGVESLKAGPHRNNLSACVDCYRQDILREVQDVNLRPYNEEMLKNAACYDVCCCAMIPCYVFASVLTGCGHDVINYAYFSLYKQTSVEAQNLVAVVREKKR